MTKTLTVTENVKALKRAHRSFVIPEIPKAGIDGYFDQLKLHFKALIEDQLKEMQSAKVIMTL